MQQLTTTTVDGAQQGAMRRMLQFEGFSVLFDWATRITYRTWTLLPLLLLLCCAELVALAPASCPSP